MEPWSLKLQDIGAQNVRTSFPTSVTGTRGLSWSTASTLLV